MLILDFYLQKKVAYQEDEFNDFVIQENFGVLLTTLENIGDLDKY
jgi:hypothetical protein